MTLNKDMPFKTSPLIMTSFGDLNEPVCPHEVDGVLGVEEFCVSQSLLSVIDKTGKFLVEKSGDCLCSLEVRIFHSRNNQLKK